MDPRLVSTSNSASSLGIVAGTSCFGKLCNPKVEHFHVAVRPEHDVLRLDVAMDNSRLVRGGERTRHLDRDVNSFTQLDLVRASDVDAASRLRSVRWRCNGLSDPRRSRKPSGYLDD